LHTSMAGVNCQVAKTREVRWGKGSTTKDTSRYSPNRQATVQIFPRSNLKTHVSANLRNYLKILCSFLLW
jgi:hypothetical protein